MTLYETYQRWHHGRITDEEAAQALNLTVKDFKFRVTRYGKKLPMVLKTLDRISRDEITRDQAAALLDVTPRHINQLEMTWGITRPLKEYLISKAVTSVKWEIRKKFAIEYIAGSCTIEEAAENAEVSDRQMRRWVIDLLEKHYQITFKDLKEVPLGRRRRMADEIEEAEGLEVAKLNVLNEVVKGQRAIQEVALERVLSKRRNKRDRNVRGIDSA